jgi:GH15 family glucan-1,4-alpha-glucosidase
MRRTVAAITETLGDRGLLRRDEQRTREGAFLPASFWLAGCQAMAGDVDGARATFERAAGCANDVGLLAEMADPATGEPLGNVPQALAHVGLVTAAQCIGDAEQGRAGAAA